MGGGREKKESKRRRKPVETANKAAKRMGGSIRMVRAPGGSQERPPTDESADKA